MQNLKGINPTIKLYFLWLQQKPMTKISSVFHQKQNICVYGWRIKTIKMQKTQYIIIDTQTILLHFHYLQYFKVLNAFWILNNILIVSKYFPFPVHF